MNVTPKEFIRVMPDAIRGFINEAFSEGRGPRRRTLLHMGSPVSFSLICAVCLVMARAKHRDI